jgi:hypothetical protein
MRSMPAGREGGDPARTNHLVRPQEELMRAAAFAAAAFVAVGVYLAVATVFTFSAAAIAVGVLLIALVAAVAVVAGGRPVADASASLADPFDFA